MGLGLKATPHRLAASSARFASHLLGGTGRTIEHEEFEKALEEMGGDEAKARQWLEDFHRDREIREALSTPYGRTTGKVDFEGARRRAKEKVDALFAKGGVEGARHSLAVGHRAEEAARQAFGGEFADKHYEIVSKLRKRAGTEGSLLRMLMFETPGVIGEMAPALAAGLATRSPAAITAYIPIIQGHYLQAGKEQGLPMKDNVIKANVFTLVEGATETIPFAKFIKLGTRGRSAILRKTLQGSAYEGAQEAVVEAMEMAYDYGVFGDDVSVGEAFRRLFHAAALGAAAGGVIGGGIATADSALGRPRAREEAARPRETPREAKTPEQAAEGVLAAKTQEEAIQAAREAVSDPLVEGAERAEADRADQADESLAEALSAVQAASAAHRADPEAVKAGTVSEAKEYALDSEADAADVEAMAEPSPVPSAEKSENLEASEGNLRETIAELGADAKVMDPQVLSVLGPAMRVVREDGGDPASVLAEMEAPASFEDGTIGNMIAASKGAAAAAEVRKSFWEEDFAEEAPAAPSEALEASAREAEGTIKAMRHRKKHGEASWVPLKRGERIALAKWQAARIREANPQLEAHAELKDVHSIARAVAKDLRESPDFAADIPSTRGLNEIHRGTLHELAADIGNTTPAKLPARTKSHLTSAARAINKAAIERREAPEQGRAPAEGQPAPAVDEAPPPPPGDSRHSQSRTGPSRGGKVRGSARASRSGGRSSNRGDRR